MSQTYPVCEFMNLMLLVHRRLAAASRTELFHLFLLLCSEVLLHYARSAHVVSRNADSTYREMESSLLSGIVRTVRLRPCRAFRGTGTGWPDRTSRFNCEPRQVHIFEDGWILQSKTFSARESWQFMSWENRPKADYWHRLQQVFDDVVLMSARKSDIRGVNFSLCLEDT